MIFTVEETALVSSFDHSSEDGGSSEADRGFRAEGTHPSHCQ